MNCCPLNNTNIDFNEMISFNMWSPLKHNQALNFFISPSRKNFSLIAQVGWRSFISSVWSKSSHADAFQYSPTKGPLIASLQFWLSSFSRSFCSQEEWMDPIYNKIICHSTKTTILCTESLLPQSLAEKVINLVKGLLWVLLLREHKMS